MYEDDFENEPEYVVGEGNGIATLGAVLLVMIVVGCALILAYCLTATPH